MQLIKVQFLHDGEPAGKRYTYSTTLRGLKPGDLVLAGPRKSRAMVAETNVDPAEGENFGDHLQNISIKVEEPEESSGNGSEGVTRTSIVRPSLRKQLGSALPEGQASFLDDDFF